MSDSALRIDKWLWFARLYKSRSLAAKVCEAGRVRINGAITDKAHASVRQGDVLTFVWNGRVRVVQIMALGSRRGPACEARMLYIDVDVGASAGTSAGDGAAWPEPSKPQKDP